ncbi:MAG: alcohol dehydrogenase catalytic domain-containing protein [Ruthenibacterium lactatiformans]
MADDKCASTCQRHLWRRSASQEGHPSAPLPVTIGHEFSGDVTAVGSSVDNVRVGQRV